MTRTRAGAANVDLAPPLPLLPPPLPLLLTAATAATAHHRCRPNTDRVPNKATTRSAAPAAANTAALCKAACDGTVSCAAWSFGETAMQCTLISGGAPQNVFSAGVTSGIKGSWTQAATGGGKGGSTLVHKRQAASAPGNSSGANSLNEQVGDFALHAPASANGASRAYTGKAVADVFNCFAGIAERESDPCGVSATGSHGGVEATVTVPPGQSRTVTVVFGWRFEERSASWCPRPTAFRVTLGGVSV
jgi:hypothetical protein